LNSTCGRDADVVTACQCGRGRRLVCAEIGAFGLPTFFVGGEMFFGKERLGQIEALLESV
jgi:2-hydroxychromene-2-carboxylate isomerase